MIAALLISMLFNLIRADDEPAVHFYSGSFQHVLAQARRQNKPLLIEVSTTWCKPCKQMEKEAFHTAFIAQKINSQFIAYQIDAQSGEGEAIARSYQVRAYPTLLFLDPNGNLRHRTIGYTDPVTLSTELDAALKSTTQQHSLAQFARQYQRGNRQKAFLYAYLIALQKVSLNGGAIIEDYVATLPCERVYHQPQLTLMAQAVSTSHSQVYDLLLTYLRRQGKSPVDAERNSLIIRGFSDALTDD